MKAMILRHLCIRAFGDVEQFEADVYADVVAVFGRRGEVLTAAVQALCGVPLSARERRWARADTVLEAVLHGKGCYRVRLSGEALTPTVTDLRDGSDCTEAYRRATRRCEEECASFVFSRRARSRYPHQLGRYLRSPPARTTDGLGRTEAFHRFARYFIRSFEAERLRQDKSLMLELDENGCFAVRHGERSQDVTSMLSETETVLFSFLCFLHLYRFWETVREAVDLHRETMPLIIRDFAEYVDAAVPLVPYLHRLRRETKQMLLLLPCEADASRLDNWPSVQTIRL